MTAAADGKLHVVSARESNRIDHVGGPEAASDQGWTPDEHAVVDTTRLVVGSVGGRKETATQAGLKVLQRCLLDHAFLRIKSATVSMEVTPAGSWQPYSNRAGEQKRYEPPTSAG